MTKLVFIHGPNGVGKSTACKALHERLTGSAWLESEWCRQTNPFTFTPEIEKIVEINMSFLLRNYLTCSTIDYVIFNYGFHGPRKKIFDSVIDSLKDIDYLFVPITLTCSVEENVKRMQADGRDETRVQRALSSRHLYEDLSYPVVDSTDLSVEEVANTLLKIVCSVTFNRH